MTLFDFMDAHPYITLVLGLQAIATAGYVGAAFASAIGRRREKETP